MRDAVRSYRMLLTLKHTLAFSMVLQLPRATGTKVVRDYSCDAASRVPAMIASCLQKLTPESMIEEGGHKKATLALALLETRASKEAAFASEFAGAEAFVPVMKTALLHPEPECRLKATNVIVLCIEQNDTVFMADAVSNRLVDGLLRLLAEQDRKVKNPDGSSRAYDPDLPTRRLALRSAEHMLLRAPDHTARDALLAEPRFIMVLLDLTNSADAGVRLHASGLLCTLTEHAECGHGVVSAFRGAEGTDQLAKMLSLLLRAMICDPDEAVSRAVTTVLLTPLRERARGGRRVPSSDLTLTLTRAL